MSRTLEAPVTVAFDYTRSVGPVLGRFFTGLAERRLIGARLAEQHGFQYVVTLNSDLIDLVETQSDGAFDAEMGMERRQRLLERRRECQACDEAAAQRFDAVNGEIFTATAGSLLSDESAAQFELLG